MGGPRAERSALKRQAERSARGGCGPTWASPGVGSGEGVSGAVFEAPALVSGFDDVAVMGEAIEHGRGHLGVAEDLGPVGEGEVGGDDDQGVLVELADEVE